jgi:acetyl-CoA carboxylase carboxyl transferase subunit alpha
MVERTAFLDFEKPIAELEKKIDELTALAEQGGAANVRAEIVKLRQKANKALVDLYRDLDPWRRTQVARHPDRPHFKDYAEALVDEFTEMAGDRKFGEDAAITGGLGRFRGRPVVVLGHEKGRTTPERLKHGAA